MSYRVLARAYRSQTFDEVVGQDSTATTLKNAIKSGRVHHGYLFTGTRGVGKTSMARILAKALNCLKSDAPTATPCCECSSCIAVAEGQDIDVVEIDAASNTGVDNIRELRSNATLRPARARFKIYIIDEVHMLSTGAFNALLKTLEEPPPHVKFILATTESQKVPATIQSRCQRFDFKAIDVTAMTAHLANIAKAEKISADLPALRRIARLANGSMRDALSLLDKLLSFDDAKITLESLNDLVPPPQDEMAIQVMEKIAASDPAGALKALDEALQTGRTVERFADHLVEHLRTLMLICVCGRETDLVDVPDALRESLADQSARFDPPTYVYMISLLEELRRNAKFSNTARALADAAVVRLALATQFTDLKDLLQRLDSNAPIATATATATPSKTVAPPSKTIPAAASNPSDAKKNEPPVKPENSRPPLSSSAYTKPQPAPPAAPVQSSTPRRPEPAALERAARDPLVQKIKSSVDGTFVDIRPIAAGAWNDSRATETPPQSEDNQQSLLE